MTAPANDGAAHVFDQTNGVLGNETGRSESPPRRDSRPPTSFGVPPIVSL